MWSQIALDVPDDLKDAVIGVLSDHDVAGVWENAGEIPGSTRLVAYFSVPFNIEKVERRIIDVFHRGDRQVPTISRSVVEERDWTEEWRKSYASFPIGDSFFVIPSWVSCSCPDERLPIRIDPGQAFGTGTHETTQLTMEALERWVEPFHVVLDVGTGSGILALASRLLGAREVIACDIDPVAVKLARRPLSFVGTAGAIRAASCDLALANINPETIRVLAPDLVRVLRTGGIAILSGFEIPEVTVVEAALRAAGAAIRGAHAKGSWSALVVSV